MDSILSILLISALPIQAVAQKENIPSILAWTEYFETPTLHTYYQWRLEQEKCEKQCNFVARSEMTTETDYDALIFNSRDLNSSDLPMRKRDDQLYYLFTLEARFLRGEEHFGEFPPNFFNGTIGYSRLNNYIFDYDWPVSNEQKVTDDLIRSKTNTVFGVISNCYSRSGREEVIEELRSHINLTLGGHCYNRNVTNEEFGQMMKSHRFILALENQLCSEYVTEKAFRYKDLIVPIVLSRRIAEEIIPSDAFIAIDDFNSISELADYLNLLQYDDEQYLKYFSWLNRKEYREVRRRGVCQLCTDLHSPRSHHSSLYRAAFPDDHLCIVVNPKGTGRTFMAVSIVPIIVLLFIVSRRCCIRNNRFRYFRLVR